MHSGWVTLVLFLTLLSTLDSGRRKSLNPNAYPDLEGEEVNIHTYKPSTGESYTFLVCSTSNTHTHLNFLSGSHTHARTLTHLYTGSVFLPYRTASSHCPRWMEASRAMSVILSLYRFSSGTSLPTVDNRWLQLSSSVCQPRGSLKEKFYVNLLISFC